MSEGGKAALVLLGVLAVLFLAAVLFGGNGDGPANAGRYILLVYGLPALVFFALAIVVTRGRWRTGVLYVLSTLGAFVVLDLAVMLAYEALR